MVKPYTVSVILPVFNEVRTISHVLQIVTTWGRAKEIIVVNDGSTDKTLQAVTQFRDRVHILSYAKNRGKGYALFWGIQKSRGDILMFLDGDIIGLTHKDLDAMMEPMTGGKADMVLGIGECAATGTFESFEAITGERLVFRKDIEPMSRTWKRIGYGVEVMMNEAYKQKRVVPVRLPFVSVLIKFDKQDIPDAMISYVKEGRDMLTQIIRDQTDSVKPHARRIIKGVINYLQEAIS